MGLTRFLPRHPVMRLRKENKPMEITLHLGAHRTASTCFQFYLRENTDRLRKHRIAVWGPWRTRDGVLSGVIPVKGALRSPEKQLVRARGRIALSLHRLKEQGACHLVVSDENMIGATRKNLRQSRLYWDVGQRMERFHEAFGGRITRVAISPRSQEAYWASALAFAVGRGHKVPQRDDLDRLVTASRNWRDVIRDISTALPEADIVVLPYEEFGGRPETKLSLMTGLDNPPRTFAREWVNRSPSLAQLRQVLRDRGQNPGLLPPGEGRWYPFDRAQASALREAYADDLFWLRAGAEGIATLIEETGTDKTGLIPQTSQTKRGQDNGIENRRLA